MKKILSALILGAMALTVTASVQAQNWSELYADGNATKVGAVYAVVCNVCSDHGRYNNDYGTWACTNDSRLPSSNYKDCKSAIVAAIVGRYNGE